MKKYFEQFFRSFGQVIVYGLMIWPSIAVIILIGIYDFLVMALIVILSSLVMWSAIPMIPTGIKEVFYLSYDKTEELISTYLGKN